MKNASQTTRPIALVVDDEPLIRMDTVDIISDAGFTVLEAATADEAFAYLLEHDAPHLLFTDIQMPGELDGLSLARKVSQLWPHIHIIIASGAVEPEAGDLPPSSRFINKPFDAQIVMNVIEKVRSPK
ncbi:response regulator [Rhizobium sp. CFBP 8762]|uniref:response regulator n=1 Tax=Rhizobium sp. CFBP 8762 TaxID=2775279 RepID=UPI00177E9323|nr:response regulator [Rhizobium sp. CFBP 8762]MBD8553950.1 response regulator [Rhizobium sp. CFBP 8762]